MARASGPKTLNASGPVLDDEIVQAANEAANDLIATYAEQFSQDFAAAAADVESEAYRSQEAFEE